MHSSAAGLVITPVSLACQLRGLLVQVASGGITSVACKQKEIGKWKGKKVFVTGKTVGQSCERWKVGLLCFHLLRSLQP